MDFEGFPKLFPARCRRVRRRDRFWRFPPSAGKASLINDVVRGWVLAGDGLGNSCVALRDKVVKIDSNDNEVLGCNISELVARADFEQDGSIDLEDGVAVPGDRRHETVRRDLPDLRTTGVGDADVPRQVRGEAPWTGERGPRSPAV